eukprot:4728656-Amphidinium_carterae.1
MSMWYCLPRLQAHAFWQIKITHSTIGPAECLIRSKFWQPTGEIQTDNKTADPNVVLRTTFAATVSAMAHEIIPSQYYIALEYIG